MLYILVIMVAILIVGILGILNVIKRRTAAIIICATVAVAINHYLSRGTCLVRDDVTMNCVSFGFNNLMLARIFVIDLLIVLISILFTKKRR